MYIEIKDNKLVSWCQNPYKDYIYVDIDYATFDDEKYSVIDGILTDVSDTDEYKAKISVKEKITKLSDLTVQIEELDKKRIRAIAEPSLRDSQNGQTWLEYYTDQIKVLRDKMSAV